MPSLIPSNLRLQTTLETYRDQINANLSLRLWYGPAVPNPATPIDGLPECFFPGYVRLPTLGTCGDPIKVLDGLYAIEAGPYSWTPTADDPNPVSGWLLAYGDVLWWSGSFDQPVPVVAGVSINLTLQIQEGSQSLCGGTG